jgi:hypothetical protein
VLAHQQARKTVGRSHADDGLDGLAVEVAAVAAQHQGLAGKALGRSHGVEHRLHEVRQVGAGGELGDLLAQTAGAGLHAGDGGGGEAEFHAGCGGDNRLR